MACATLKRSLDWETLNQRPTKRRRCNPFGQIGGSPQSAARSAVSSPSSGHCGNATFDTFGNVNTIAQSSPTSSRCARELNATASSAFSEARISQMSPDKMARDIHDEIKRLHKRNQLPFTAAAMERMQDSESSGSEMGPDSPRRPDTPPSIVRNPEKALFTFKQVQLICERMLKEREEEIREKYDEVLSTKLAEQYDAFVKFTYDQIQRRYEAAPSYLS